MTINRYNYEEFFLLYTDNELNHAEREAVEAFAAANPDLREELDLLQQFRMVPEETSFPDISSLIRPETAGSIVDEANCEEKFLLYIDNELDTPEKKAVERFVQEHPAMQPLFEQLKNSVVQPDESIRFPDKQVLYRSEQEKVIPFGWWKVAAAALVLLVAGTLWLNNSQTVPAKGTVAQADEKVAPPKTDLSGQAAPDRQEAGAESKDFSMKQKVSPDNEPLQEQVASLDPAAGHITAGSTSRTRNSARATQRVQRMPAAVDNADQLPATNLVAQNKISVAAVEMQKNIIDEAVSLNTHTALADDEAGSGVSFASSNDADDVYVSNIPVDKKHALRGLLRKASRVINKAAGLNGEKSILIGSVELALK